VACTDWYVHQIIDFSVNFGGCQACSPPLGILGDMSSSSPTIAAHVTVHVQ